MFSNYECNRGAPKGRAAQRFAQCLPWPFSTQARKKSIEINPGKYYIRPPPPLTPFLAQRGFYREGGGEPPRQEFYTPPLSYIYIYIHTPPTPRRVFSPGVLRSKAFFDPILVVFRDFCKSDFWHPYFYRVFGYFRWFRWFLVILVFLAIFDNFGDFGDSGDRQVGWGSSTRRGGGRKARALPRKFIFLGFRRREPGLRHPRLPEGPKSPKN